MTKESLPYLPKSKRAIRLVNVSPELRRVLADCQLPGCRKCTEGFEQFKGQQAIICNCAWDLFKQTCQFFYDEDQRRKSLLPPRQMYIRDRQLHVVDAEVSDLPSQPIQLIPSTQSNG